MKLSSPGTTSKNPVFTLRSLIFSAALFLSPILLFSQKETSLLRSQGRDVPVKIINWSGYLEHNVIKLTWSAVPEVTLSHFTLERSYDGKKFSDAAILFTLDTSTALQHFSLTDMINRKMKGVVYYRLKFVDLDNHYGYSDIRLINLRQQSPEKSLVIYENPANNELRLTISPEWQRKKLVFEIVSETGQLLKRTLRTNKDKNESIEISDLKPGIYWIRITRGKIQSTQQFIKSKIT